MEYHGKLYGKMNRHLIPLCLTSEDVDRMQIEIQDREREIEELRGIIMRCEGHMRHALNCNARTAEYLTCTCGMEEAWNDSMDAIRNETSNKSPV